MRDLRVVHFAVFVGVSPVLEEDVGDGERRPQRPLYLDPGCHDDGLVAPPPLVQPVHVGGVAADEAVPNL